MIIILDLNKKFDNKNNNFKIDSVKSLTNYFKKINQYMIIHQEDSYNENYTVNFYIDNIEIINKKPKDNFNKSKLYFDLVIYYLIDNIIIKYNDKIFHNEEELKMFFSNIILKYFIDLK